MDLLLHTIALESARWTPQRVSRPLVDLLPHIAGAGFRRLEIFEPHLTHASDEGALVSQLATHRLSPIMLSSYLDLAAAPNFDEAFARQAEQLIARVDRFGFRKVRLFPGRSSSAERTEETIGLVTARLQILADARTRVEFLLETHDGSLADVSADIVGLVEACARPNVGLLWQPTIFEAQAAIKQFELQKPLVRHFHLQNRMADTSRFATMRNGIIPWDKILTESGMAIDATLEFVPAGICSPENFNLEESLAEAVMEFNYLGTLLPARHQ